MGCTPGALDSLWNTISGNLTSCQQSALVAQESTAIQNASGLALEDANNPTLTPQLYSPILTDAQAQALASGDVNSVIQLQQTPAIDPSTCTGFTQLAQFSILSSNWFTCAGNAIQSYLVWIIVAVVAIVLLYGYVSSR